MRKLLAILFFAVFSSLLLPIEDVGRMLWKGQLTEEINEHGTSKTSTPTNEENKLWYHDYAAFSASPLGRNASFTHLMIEEALIKSHHPEVLLQPPNLVC